MAEYTGSGLYLKFGTVVYNTAYRAFAPVEKIDLVDSSAGADAFRTRIVTLRDGDGSLELVAQSGDTVVWPAFVPGAAGSLIWGEEGTATSKPKHSVTSAIVKSRAQVLKYDDLVVYKLDFQFNDVVVDAVFP